MHLFGLYDGLDTRQPAEAPVIEVSMLDGFSIRCGSAFKAYHPRAKYNWALIAYLILHKDRMVSRIELMDVFADYIESVDPARTLRNRLMRTRVALDGISTEAGRDLILIHDRYCRWAPGLRISYDTDRFLAECGELHNLFMSGQAPADYADRREALLGRYGAGVLPMLDDAFRSDDCRMAKERLEFEAGARHAS